MKKEVSFGKLERVSKLPDANIYIKPSVKTHWRQTKSQVDTFASVEVFVVHNGFKYQVEEVWDYINGIPITRKVVTRSQGVGCDLAGCVKLEDIILKGKTMLKGKSIKLEIGEKLWGGLILDRV